MIGKKCPRLKKQCIGEECALFVDITRNWKDHQGVMHSEQKGVCADVANVYLAIDTIGANNGIQKSIEGLKNETVKSHNNVLSLFNVARQKALGEDK